MLFCFYDASATPWVAFPAPEFPPVTLCMTCQRYTAVYIALYTASLTGASVRDLASLGCAAAAAALTLPDLSAWSAEG